MAQVELQFLDHPVYALDCWFEADLTPIHFLGFQFKSEAEGLAQPHCARATDSGPDLDFFGVSRGIGFRLFEDLVAGEDSAFIELGDEDRNLLVRSQLAQFRPTDHFTLRPGFGLEVGLEFHAEEGDVAESFSPDELADLVVELVEAFPGVAQAEDVDVQDFEFLAFLSAFALGKESLDPFVLFGQAGVLAQNVRIEEANEEECLGMRGHRGTPCTRVVSLCRERHGEYSTVFLLFCQLFCEY